MQDSFGGRSTVNSKNKFKFGIDRSTADDDL